MRLAGRGQWLLGSRGSEETAQTRDKCLGSAGVASSPWRCREEWGPSDFQTGGLDLQRWLTVVLPYLTLPPYGGKPEVRELGPSNGAEGGPLQEMTPGMKSREQGGLSQRL